MSNKKSRLKYSITNSIVGSVGQIVTILSGFILQTIFIHTLGSTYLGVKGLFSNILSVLSFTELGIGTAITFSLYKPLAHNDQREIALIMHFFKRAYELIGITVGILGILVIPFIHTLTHARIPYLYTYYLLYLANTVVSYFYTYKRTLLNADQLNYINLINQVGFKVIQMALQIVVLLVFKSFLWFLIIQLVITIISNIIISIDVDRRYRYLSDPNLYQGRLDKETIHEIFYNTVGSIGEKIGTIVVNSTDNILVSYFLNLSWVGIYSNYLMITGGVTNIISQAISAISASIGNLAVEKHDDKNYQLNIFNRSFFIVFAITYFCSVCLLTLVNPFISIWVGERYQMDNFTVTLLAINFMITGIRTIFISFVTAYGLYPKDGVKAVIEAALNFVLSVIYIKFLHLGVAGVILGTISSNILANWYEPYMIFKYGINKGNELPKFYTKCISYMILITVMMILSAHFLPMLVPIKGFIGFGILALITILFAVLSFVILFRHNQYFGFLIKILKKIVIRH